MDTENADNNPPNSTEPIFPPLQTKFTVPQGPFLAPVVQSSEGGRTYISKSGFERLATSSYFVERVRKDVDNLLDTFVKRWKDTSNVGGKKRKVDEENLESVCTSPFQVFKSIFEQQGWHQVQLFWSENDTTRSAMYDTTIRIFAESLKTLSKAFISVDDTIKQNEDIHFEEDTLLRACGSLFGLHLVRSTSIIASKHRHTPGYGVYLPLEAELLHILNGLPRLLDDILQQPQSENGLRPIDDVIFILYEIQKPSEFGVGDTYKDLVIDMLLPTHYHARPSLVTSKLSNRAESDRLGGEYGKIIDEEHQKEYPLNRTEMASILIREAIGMPLLVPTEDGQGKKDVIFKDVQQGSTLTFQPSTSRHTHWRSANHIGVPITTQQQKLKEVLNETAEATENYQKRIRDIFGDEGITGTIFSHPPTKRLESEKQSVNSEAEGSIRGILDRARMETKRQLVKRMRDARQRRSERETGKSNAESLN